MSKEELLSSIRDERARLDAVVHALGEADLSEPSLDGGWSVKDVLAHIAVWERRLLTALEAAARGDVPVWPEVGYTFRDTDRLNARDFEANRGRSLEDVRRESRRSFEETLGAIERFSEDDLTRGDRWPWANGMSLVQMMSPNTDEHYREHAAAIEARAEQAG